VTNDCLEGDGVVALSLSLLRRVDPIMQPLARLENAISAFRSAAR
jgi:hypothetical protein